MSVESFERLAVQYQQMIYKIIHSLNIYKEIDEFYQIGLIALWDASRLFDHTKGDFPGYVYKFIKGRILSELTKTSKHEGHCLFPKDSYWELIEDGLEKQPCEAEILLSYCEGLTNHQKKWVTYTFIDDLSVVEIAAKENVSVSAVKQWRTGAWAKLKKIQLA